MFSFRDQQRQAGAEYIAERERAQAAAAEAEAEYQTYRSKRHLIAKVEAVGAT